MMNYWNELTAELTSLENRHKALQEDHRKLAEFHDYWNNTLVYRIVRETKRPFRRLSRYLQQRRAVRAAHESLQAEPAPTKKAA